MVETKTAIVTGAGSGIGKASAITLLKVGWNVVFTGRRIEKLEAAIKEAGKTKGKALAVACDVANPQDVDRLFAGTIEKFLRLDLLFNNAGAAAFGAHIDEITLEDWYRVVDVNLNGAFLCARAAYKQMRKQSPQGGRIINNGSISAYVPRPLSVPYTTTKHAISGLTRTLALDGRQFDIACGQIDIGNAASEITQNFDQGVAQADGSTKPEPIIDVQHVADTVLHMASLPLDANMLFVNVMATKMPFVGRG